MTEQEIIDAAVEKALRLIPDVIGRILMERGAMEEIKKKFWGENPGFEKHKEIVAAVISEVEGRNPGKQYEKILEEATSVIRQRIQQAGNVSLSAVPRPSDLTFKGGHGNL